MEASKCTGPKIKKPAPYFEGTAYYENIFQDIKLTDYKGKYVVLFFYPADFTFVCPTEIREFSEQSDNFKNTNCQVIGCSVDTHFVHQAYSLKPKEQAGLGPMKIPLLSDKSHAISQAYGTLIHDGPDAGLALRGTFIIDTEGILRHMSYNDLGVGRNVDEYFRLVKAFQYADEHGDVIPCKWKPGQKGIKPGN